MREATSVSLAPWFWYAVGVAIVIAAVVRTIQHMRGRRQELLRRQHASRGLRS